MSRSTRRILTSSGVIATCLFLASCAGIPGFSSSEKKAEATALEKAGRITMVLGDEKVEVDPDLITQAITLPPAQVKTAWPQAGSSSSKQVGHVAAAENLEIAWRANIGSGSNQKAALSTVPVASETAVFTLNSSQGVVATDLATGRRLWATRLDGRTRRDRIGSGGGLAVEGNTLVVASGYGFITALDASTGAELWKREMNSPMTGAPAVLNDRIFVSSNNNEVFAMDLATGQIQWDDQAIAEPARVLGSPSPAAVEDFIVAPYSSGEIIAYRSDNGRRLWTDALSQSTRFTPISEINDIGSHPILAGGLVFVSSQSGVTVAIDGRSGNRAWTTAIGSVQPPALAGSALFVVGSDARLAALRPDTGGAYWVSEMKPYRNVEKKKDRISYVGPIVASNRILVASSQGDLIAFSPDTGEELSRRKIGGSVFVSPIVAGDKLLILTDKGQLVAVN